MRYENKAQVLKDYVLKSLSYYLDYPMVQPERINIATTFSCPLNCSMCGIPDLEDPEREELDIEEWKEIIDQVDNWGIDQVSFSGGETMARKDKTLTLMEYAHRKGMEVDLITNGYFLDEETAKRIINSGVERVSLSVDGSKSSIHDSIRGNGSFDKIMSAIENLNKFRGIRDDIEYEFTTVVMNKNYDDLISIYKLMKEKNFDYISYQALLPDNSFEIDQSFNNDLWLSSEEAKELEKIVRRLIEVKSETGDIRNTKKYLRKIPEYFRRKEKFSYGKCMAGYEVIHIDPYGRVDLCGFEPQIDLKGRELQKAWKSKEYKKLRRKVKECDRPCLLLCYRKLDFQEMAKTHFEASISSEE